MGRILLFKCTYVLLKSLKLKYIDTLKYFTNHCAMCLVAQSCLTLWDPMDYSPPGSSVHGILQARILKWVAMPSSGDLPDPGIEPMSPALQVDSLPSELPGNVS